MVSLLKIKRNLKVTMNNTIKSDDLYYDLAQKVIEAKEPPSTTTAVLAEIIRYSEVNSAMITIDLGNNIRARLGLSGPNYRKSMSRLYRIGAIKKIGSTTFLNFKFHQPITSITLK